MSDPSLFRLRVRFVKQGRLALLSHLEVARALERTVRRAGLPYAVSQGFSPHMKISFGAALPVGVGGTDEFFDLLLTRYINPREALDALAASSAPDMMCTSAAYVDPGAKAASVAFPLSVYRAQLSRPVELLAVPRTVTAVRKGKATVKNVEQFLGADIELAGTVVTFSLLFKPEGSLRPDMFLQACLELTERLESGNVDSQMESGVLQRVPNSAFRVTDGAGSLRVVSCTRIDQR